METKYEEEEQEEEKEEEDVNRVLEETGLLSYEIQIYQQQKKNFLEKAF